MVLFDDGDGDSTPKEGECECESDGIDDERDEKDRGGPGDRCFGGVE